MELYQAKLTETVRSAASEGTEIDVLRLPEAIVAGKGFASAQALELRAMLRAIAAAVESGYEAVGIGNGFDPGLWEARELFEIPVLGLFETVSMFALRVGWRFGVICSGNSGVSRVEEMAARYGIAGRMVRPVAVGISVPQVVGSFGDPKAAAEIHDSVTSLAGELAARGAEVGVVASGALDVFLSTQPAISTPIPVLPSVKILVKELEAAAHMARLWIPSVSRAGRFAKPPASILEYLRAE